jgi:hypothetical protein
MKTKTRPRAFTHLSDCNHAMPIEASRAMQAMRQAVIDVGLTRQKMSKSQWARWIRYLSLLPACAEEVHEPTAGAFADGIHDPRLAR